MSDASKASGAHPGQRLFSIVAILVIVLPAAWAGARVTDAMHAPKLVAFLFVLFAFPLSQILASWAHKKCYGPPPAAAAAPPEATPDDSREA